MCGMSIDLREGNMKYETVCGCEVPGVFFLYAFLVCRLRVVRYFLTFL